MCLASFSGRRRNAMTTCARSNCIWIYHGNCNMSYRQLILDVTLMIFPAVRIGLSCLLKQLLQVLLLKWNRSCLNKTRRAEHLVEHGWTIAIEMEWHFNPWHNYILLLSCDNVLKFNWYCQLSDSRSNSLNSRKFPARFSYGCEMRLRCAIVIIHHTSIFSHPDSLIPRPAPFSVARGTRRTKCLLTCQG